MGHKTLRFFLWPIYYRIFKKRIKNQKEIPDELIKKLIYAWGNQGFSAKTEYLQACLKIARQCNKPILECGSGLTTVLVGEIAKQRKIPVYSLENNENWYLRVKKMLDKNELIYSKLLFRPTTAYENFEWYETKETHFPKFELVICDGPHHSNLGGRIGLFPLMKDHFSKGTKILVDDTIRDADRKMIQEWEKLHRMKIVFKGVENPFASLELI